MKTLRNQPGAQQARRLSTAGGTADQTDVQGMQAPGRAGTASMMIVQTALTQAEATVSHTGLVSMPQAAQTAADTSLTFTAQTDLTLLTMITEHSISQALAG